MSSPIRLGPFTLQEVIGRGGMGEVWRARHTSGVAVAIKVLTADGARRALFRDALGAEIVAVARLEHPALIAVHDHGRVDATAERASGGALRTGSPWMAMDLVDGRSLDGHEGTLPWDEAARVAAEVLEGLAHAHARGVVHRDVKPANLLLDRAGAVRLGDFGIARRDDQGDAAPMATPDYAPPEQLHRVHGAQGPWTDVFATGRLLAALIAPGSLVPAGLGGWFARATAPAAQGRFPSARHAVTALANLGPPEVAWSGRAASTGRETLLIDDFSGEAEPTGEPGPVIAPTVGSWQQPTRRDDPLRRVAGLALWGFRPPRLTGREAICEAMWGVFAEAVAAGPRVLLLRGPPNLGKTRLARTLGEQAHAASGALVLATRCDPAEAATESLGRLVSAAVGAAGLPTHQLVAHFDATVPDLSRRDRDALAGLLGAPASHRSIDDLFPALAALFRTLTAPPEWNVRRPIVLVVEDAQHGPDLLRWARRLLAAGGSHPLLLLGVVDDDASTEHARVALDALSREPSTRILEVEPLEADAVCEIVRDLVALDDDLAAEIAQWTGGRPLFAVQVLTDWVRRDALQAGPNGFRLRSEGDALPPRREALWSERLAAWERETSESARTALEAAAVLGDRIGTPFWDDLCAAVGSADPRAALEDLRAAGLARTSPGEAAWWFADPSLRVLVHRRASEGGRAAHLHRLVAGVLAARSDAWPGRQGRLLLLAGEPLQALTALVEALSVRRRASREQLDAAAADLAVALDQSDLPATSNLFAGALVVLAQHARDTSGPDPLPGLLAAWPAHARWDPEVAARMAHTIARLNLQRGDLPTARRWLDETLHLATDPGDPQQVDLLHQATLDLADSLRVAGDLEAAQPLFERVAAEANRPLNKGFAWMGLSDCALARGDLDRADSAAATGWRILEPSANSSDLISLVSRLGTLARLRGDYDAAAAHYERAMGVMPWSIVSSRANSLNLALLRLLQGRVEAVEPLLAWARATDTQPFYNGAGLLLRCCARAAAHDRAAWDAEFPEASRLLARSGIVEPDLAIAAEWAAARWGDDPRAAEARAIAAIHRPV